MNALSATQRRPATTRKRTSWSRRLRRGAAIVGGTIVVVVGGLVGLYCFPPPGDAAGADLVYVIGPATQPRLEEAEAIIQATGHNDLLVSVSGGSTATFSAPQMPICSEAAVTCEHPLPSTTKGEALLLNEYAQTHEVHKVVVLTVTPHVARTRYIFARCSPEIDVQVVPVDEHLSFEDWVHQFAYQTGAFVKAIATPCARDDE